MRVGIGYDVHPFREGREMWLGCVRIPAARGLEGHSDADVLAHAIADALLGAAGLEDVGQHFPATPEWSGVSGAAILEHVARAVRDAGFRIGNVDCQAILEEPKIGPHRAAMRTATAQALGVDETRVSIKATSSDKLGFIGRGEGAAALAVALLEPVGPQPLG